MDYKHLIDGLCEKCKYSENCKRECITHYDLKVLVETYNQSQKRLFQTTSRNNIVKWLVNSNGN